MAFAIARRSEHRIKGASPVLHVLDTTLYTGTIKKKRVIHV